MLVSLSEGWSSEAAPGPGRRVLIDALAARFGGTAYATVHLAGRLAARADTARVIVVAREGSLVAQGLEGHDDVICLTLAASGRAELVRRLAWEAARLPHLAAQTRADVLVSMSGILPRPPRCAVIALLFNPVMYQHGGASNVLRRRAARRTAVRAKAVIAPSRFMADLVTRSIGRTCEVVPLGIDHLIFTPGRTAGEEILCVADFYRHKRQDLLLDAWLRLRAPRPRLRFIGSAAVDPSWYQTLSGRLGTLAGAGEVTVEHGVPLSRLVDAYRQARVFVMASEHESFCMPVLESMACGIPCVLRSLPSLCELGGAAATYVDGGAPDVWAAEIQRLVDDDDEHERLRQAAVRRAAGFSWDMFAGGIASRF